MGRDSRLSIVRDNQTGVLDRLGRPLDVGDIVTPLPGQHILVRLTEIRPQMDPAHPKGHLIHGRADFQFFSPAGRPLPDLLLVVRPAKKEEPHDTGTLPTGGTIVKDVKDASSEAHGPSAMAVRDEVASVPVRVWRWLRRAPAGLLLLALTMAGGCDALAPGPSETCTLTQNGTGVYASPGFATVNFGYTFSKGPAQLTSIRKPDLNQAITSSPGFVNLVLGVSGSWDLTLTTAGGCVAKASYCNGNCG